MYEELKRYERCVDKYDNLIVLLSLVVGVPIILTAVLTMSWQWIVMVIFYASAVICAYRQHAYHKTRIRSAGTVWYRVLWVHMDEHKWAVELANGHDRSVLYIEDYYGYLPKFLPGTYVPCVRLDGRLYPDIYYDEKIGGGSVYRQMLPFCDTVYVTKADAAYDADMYCPDLDKDEAWSCVDED